MPRRTILTISLCSLTAASVFAALVTLKELDLMVRMHMSDAEILRAVSQRQLSAPLDAAGERQLQADGASPALLSKIKAGNYVLSPDKAAEEARFMEQQKALVANEKAADAIQYAELLRRQAAPVATPVPAPSAAQKAPPSAAAPIGRPLDIQFTAVDGRPVNLQEMKGKVVLVDFWATWCGPCVGEIPHVKAAYDRLHDKGFEVIGLSFDQSQAKLQDFVAQRGIPWPQYFDGAGWENKYGKQWEIRGIPTMWLVDKRGLLRDANARGDLENKVEQLLAE